jgi:hypothetical protein
MRAGRIAVLGLALAGCDPPATAPPVSDVAEVVATPERPELAVKPEVTPVVAVAGPPVPKGWSWVIAPAARPSLTQVAGLGPERALALGDGRLYALAGARWR